MLLRDKLHQESQEALKTGDKAKVSVLRFLISILDKRGMQLPLGKMTPADELLVLQKELKNKNEAKAMFEEAGRKDLVEEVDYEISVLKKYLPEQMEEIEVEKVVMEVLAGNKDLNFGQVMGMVMAKLQGKADGTVVSKMVKEKLGE